ncbi:MAG: dienelactone hydrolase [Proteobacteria bacterium]|nr:dienelactone hydrolase [Pseudomonadota bacterium]
MRWKATLTALVPAFALLGPCMAGPPSQFGVDAPELAHLGASAVGVRTLALVQRKQEDVLSFNPANRSFQKSDRALTVDLWYPAAVPDGAQRESYTASLPSEPPAPPVSFTVPGIAVRDAPAAGKAHPLVVVSHGYSNSPAAMTWLTENLASKGYVVAAIRHDDPPITDKSRFAQLLARRPLDVAYVTRSLKDILAREKLIDPSRVALVGYSMGGYGVLTAAGATLDPTSPLMTMVPGAFLNQYARGGSKHDAVTVEGVRAVVALAPAGGGNLAAWGAEGLRGIHAPLLLISGNRDRTVDYATGAHAIFEGATNADRYLLTFKEGGHSIGLNPVPDAMRTRLWDQDWFADPVWRKDRINAINVHFITAFLDRYVRDDVSRDSYLNVSGTDSDAGQWPAESTSAYAAVSPGANGISVWKGFQRNHAAGLELLQAKAAAHAN